MSLQKLDIKQIEDYDFIIEMVHNVDQHDTAPNFRELESIQLLEYMNGLVLFSELEHIQHTIPALAYIATRTDSLEAAKKKLYAICKQNSERLH